MTSRAVAGPTNLTMVAALHRQGVVHSPLVKLAMETIDRVHFIPSSMINETLRSQSLRRAIFVQQQQHHLSEVPPSPSALTVAQRNAAVYKDSPHPIGCNVTISAPHMHAIMLEIIAAEFDEQARQHSEVTKEEVDNEDVARNKQERKHWVEAWRKAKFLDVGSGSGYLCAVLAQMQHLASASGDGGSTSELTGEGPGPTVYGVEHMEELVANSKESIKTALTVAPFLTKEGHVTYASPSKIAICQGDARSFLPTAVGSDDASAAAPILFDIIHVGAAAAEIPQLFLDRLAPGGRLVVPVGPEGRCQTLTIVDKELGPEGKLHVRADTQCAFVPLTSAEHQHHRQ